MSNDRDYMREYMLRRYHRRRIAAIQTLGGKCVVCGTSENLEIDHRDANNKSFHVGKALTSMAKAKLEAELLKCQLLCREHHEAKSLVDMGHEAAKHGSRTMYRHHGCRCDVCKDAQNAYCREYKRNRRAKQKAAA